METTTPVRTASSALESRIAALLELDVSPDLQQRRRAALEVAEIVRTLDADDDVVLAAILQPLLEAGVIDREAAATRLGAEATRLARALSELGEFGLPPDWTPERGLEPLQAEALRKMLRGRHRRCAAGGGQARRAIAAHARGQDPRGRR